MKKLLYRIYQRIKTIPILGRGAKMLRNALHHPLIERRVLFARDRKAAHDLMTTLYEVDSPAHRYLEAFLSSPRFRQSYSYGHSGDFDVMVLYTLVRMLEPEIIIETGVASGRSSAAILEALAGNGKGRLYSIDLPQFYSGDAPDLYKTDEGNSELKGFVPKGKEPGWLVPKELRDRWELILGDSNVELPKLFAKLPKINMFYHDGDHSYETMSFEFRSAWEKIPEGGYLLSDDTKWNVAWKEFADSHEEAFARVYRNFGVMRKA